MVAELAAVPERPRIVNVPSHGESSPDAIPPSTAWTVGTTQTDIYWDVVNSLGIREGHLIAPEILKEDA